MPHFDGRRTNTKTMKIPTLTTMALTILYADDDSDDRMLVQEAFSEIEQSVSCITVCDGRQLLQLLNKVQNLPDVVFLDINMPGMDGRECLIELKRDRRFRNIPVVIYSTTSSQTEIKDYLRLGAMSFIQKPDSYPKLCACLARIVQSLNAG
jgi:CheY-like chemotaxis protein